MNWPLSIRNRLLLVVGSTAPIAFSEEKRKCEYLVVGAAGVAGIAAVRELPRDRRICLMDGDGKRLRQIYNGLEDKSIIESRADWLDAEARVIKCTNGEIYSYETCCILALGSATPHVPSDFVDTTIRNRVFSLGGYGRAQDEAVSQLAMRAAANGLRVAILGGSQPACDLAARCGEKGKKVYLLMPEHGPMCARLPRWQSQYLKKRLKKARVRIRTYSQIRYIGDEDSGKMIRLYHARSFDALSTSSIDVDLVVVAGGEHSFQHQREFFVHESLVLQPGMDERTSLGAPRGAARIPADTKIALNQLASPIAVDDRFSAADGVLCCGDCSASPSRLHAATYLAAVPLDESAPLTAPRYAVSVSSHAGFEYAALSGRIAGQRAAALSKKASCAKGLDFSREHIAYAWRQPALGSDFSLIFLGKCDSELETHTLFPASSSYRNDTSVTFYLERRKPKAPARIVGIMLWGDAFTPQRQQAENFLCRYQSASLCQDIDSEGLVLRQLANKLLSSRITTTSEDEISPNRFQHRIALSRSDRLGPSYAPGAAAGDTAIFSRGRNASMTQRISDAYTSGIKHGIDSDAATSEVIAIQNAAISQQAAAASSSPA